jgi:hypothetical protein
VSAPESATETVPLPSDYDGWGLSEATAVVCEDCGQRSAETDSLKALLDWIDAHQQCTGYATNFEETADA